MTFAKALVAALVAAVGTLYVASAENGVSLHEWVGVLVSTLGALALVFQVPNKPPLT